MAHQVKIPAAGESINSATVGQWHKRDGDTVAKGDLLVTIETDKVSTELEAEAAGTLHIAVAEGEEVAIGAVIAEIEKEGERKSAAKAKKAARKAAKKQVKKKTAARTVAKTAAKAARKPEPPAKPKRAAGGKTVEIRVPAAGESITSATIAQWHKRDGDQVEAGEAVVTLDTDKVSAEVEAEQSGVLSIVAPEGKEVKIGAVIGTIAVGATAPESATETDAGDDDEGESVEGGGEDDGEDSKGPDSESSAREAVAARAPVDQPPARLVPDLSVVPQPPAQTDRAETSDGRTTRRRMSTLRRKIAAQLVKAQQTAAILTTFNEADMTEIMKLRKAVQDDFVAKYSVKLGFMSFFVKAVVQALKEVPSVNGRIDGDEIVQNHFYDIGIAVGTERGLIVPVVRDADRKTFAQIEQDILDYATKARDGKIQLEDLQGGSFTISNGGIYGSLLSTPILNPPQSGILGMHTIQQRPVAIDGKVEIRPMMYLALSYDHRLVDGKEAVTFLIHVKNGIENPTRLMLELA